MLIFSYPVNRKCVLLAKFAVVSIFTFIAMVVCSYLSLGILATGIGFIKKSVPTTIVSAVVIVSVLSNLIAGALTNDMFLLITMIITMAAALFVAGTLVGKVNRMEVE